MSTLLLVHLWHFKWYIVSPDIAQVVERWRGKREIAGSNPNKTFFNNSFVLFVYFFIRPSSDGAYYGMVMSVRPSDSPSVRPSDSPSVRPSDSPSVRPTLRPGLCPPVFHTFLLHALIHWAEILHMTLFYCTTDQVRVSSICVSLCESYAPFGT